MEGVLGDPHLPAGNPPGAVGDRGPGRRSRPAGGAIGASSAPHGGRGAGRVASGLLMSEDVLDTLLDRLNRGDMEAAEQVVRAYEPYLRVIARRNLSSKMRSKLDSVDVVQTVWLEILRNLSEGRVAFPDAAQLRAYLVMLTRNRLIDSFRRHRRSMDLERPLREIEPEGHPASVGARPSQVAQADELWDLLLERCSPNQREVLRLKREGISLGEIAGRTGLHKSSVRRLIYEAERHLARLAPSADGRDS